MTNPLDTATPEPDDTYVQVADANMTREQVEAICRNSSPCRTFMFMPVTQVLETNDGDESTMEGVEQQVLLFLADADDRMTAVTFPLLAFDAFMQLACDTYEKVRGPIESRVNLGLDGTEDRIGGVGMMGDG
jgi:hypothetical protein